MAFMTSIARDVASILRRADSTGNRAYGTVRQRVRDVPDGIPDCRFDEEAVTQVLWATMHGMVSLFLNVTDFPWAEGERLIETSIDLMVVGLTAGNGRRNISTKG